ncbi:MAG: DHA2 family efflux MFS transporter permease subunit [Candidatus Eremiobacteraeota bacterium]|nr:DHA2 family efflux MFS transporter permease subunit [Candidatus Eremiobacteraeota bacterium]
MAIALKPSRPLVTPPAAPRAAAAAAAVSPAAVLIVVMLGNFLGPLYSSTANVIIPNLIASFGSDVDTMEWVVTGYMLGYSITMPLAGWLADTFGRKRMFLIGLAMFTIFSICASMSTSTGMLIMFRILQAVGGGIISPTGMAIVTDVIPPHQRGRALGLWGMGMMLAPAFGPWISGLIVDNLDDWRLVFWLGVPFGIAGLLAAVRALPGEEDRPTRARTAFDYIGFGALSSSLTLFLIPLTQGNRLGWDDPWIMYSFIASAVMFALFIWNELRVKHPMIDLALFRDRTFSVAVFLRAVLGTGYYFSIFLIPLFTQTILGWDATQSGLVLLPAGLAMAILMPIAGTLADKIGARVLVVAGMIIAAYGTFLFARIDIDWEFGRLAIANLIRTGALGLLFTPLTTAALTNMPRNRTGSASGILNTVWQVGGSLGIAVGQAYLTARSSNDYIAVASSLNSSRIPVMQYLQQMHGVATFFHLPPGSPQAMLSELAMEIATVRAYGDTFLLGAAMVAIAVPLAFILPHRRKA